MNPYDNRKAREIWARVRPGWDVFAPPGKQPDPNGRPPARPPGPPRPGQGGKPPGNGPWPPPPPPPPPPEAQNAADQLVALAAGYDDLARRMRLPWLRRLAAQCRRNARALQDCAGVQGREIPNTRADLCAQRRGEQALRDLLDRLDGPCRDAAVQLRRDSVSRTRMLSRLR